MRVFELSVFQRGLHARRLFMYLSGLKVNGFKSFADPTHLRFEPGVTAVVGPNGCGKSNIADAVRWVLGEQSAKALRGGRMQDVIFEGTDKRKPLNLCEVAITLTECEDQLGSEFNEIEISRRVHRDGGSNYYINGKACRLKDIQRLFMDTGVGRTSYSIMAQGQIDQILSSKPEERRSVFEEAAGISKYKSQRREAMLKLEHVEANLSRVTDVVAEINRQIGSLRRQAGKAIRYKKLSHKLRHLEVGYSAYQHGALRVALRDIDQNAGSLAGQVGQLEKELQSKEHHLVINKEERQALIQRVQDAQQSVFDLRSRKEQAANEAHMAEIRISSMQERMESAREEIASYEQQIAEIAEKLDERSQDKQMQMDVLGNSDEVFRERNRELAEIEAKMDSIESEIQRAKGEARDAEVEVDRRRQRLSALEVEAGTSENRLKRLEEELGEHADASGGASKALEDFRKRLDATRALQAELQTGLEAARDLVEEKRGAFRSAQGRIQELDRGVAQRAARVKLLQQLQEKLEGYGEGAKALLKGRMQGALEGKAFVPLASNLSVRDGYGPAVEALLGSAVEAVAVDGADTAIEVFRQLEERKIGRACLKLAGPSGSAEERGERPPWLKSALDFVSLRDDEAGNALRAVLQASFIVEDMGGFLKWWETHGEFRFLQVATPNGEMVDARGVVSGGYRSAKGSSIVQREIELKQTAKELQSEQKTLAEARQEAEKLNHELEEAEGEVESKRQQIHDANRELSSLQAEVRNAERSVQQQKEKAERLERERKALQQARTSASEKLEAARSELAKERDRLEAARARQSEAEAGIESVRALRDEKREALSQAKFDLQDKKQQLDLLNRGLVEMDQRRSELRGLIESKTRDIESWEEQTESLQEDIARSKEQGESVEQELEEAKALVEKTKEALVGIEEKIDGLEKEQRAAREKLDTLRSSLNGQQVQIAEKKSRLEFIQEEVTREYGIELDTIDWKHELWKARQPVRNLPKLDDLDQGGEAGEEDESEGEAATDGAALEGAEEPEQAGSDKLSPSAPSSMPTEEELAELDATDWKRIQTEVQALRKRIQNMGAVNLVAIEEYGELRERHAFLKGQYDDLVSSRDKLVSAIEEINVKSREQFSETFDRIRENFKNTFTTLFGGGKADLQLIESEDILESGIEIVAQPPGTRLKSVSLLSGGQRTMTAVGLLFAIYLVKPSPFCLLDELDAPLDESNIGRFTALLKQFTKHSQFIIITHNKRTIAASQAIYGVTMEEKGVSKVVSMKFSSEHDDPDLVSLQLESSVASA